MQKSKVLGRGFSSLLPSQNQKSKSDAKTATPYASLPVNVIHSDPGQPRKTFSAESLSELAQSINRHGLLQPLVVTPLKGKAGEYRLVAGERRFRALKIAGKKMVPVIIRETSEDERLEVALIENIQRQDLTAVEEAKAFKTLMSRFSWTQDELASKVSKSRSNVANTVRLLKLPKSTLAYLEAGKLTPGQVRPLIHLDDVDLIEAEVEKILSSGLTAREIETKHQVKKPKKKTRSAKSSSAYSEVEETLRRKLATKVHIRENGQKGVIEIHYYNGEDLTRILNHLRL